VACGHYETLTPEGIDRVWLRLRAGQAVKPADRELRLSPSTVLTYCCVVAGSDRGRGAAVRAGCGWRSVRRVSRGLAAGRSYRESAAALDRARR
jgi:hypothetical protein